LLNDELVKLKAELLDAKKQYTNLLDASGSGAEVSRLTNELEAAKQALKETVEARDNIVNGLTEECTKLKAAAENALIERNAAITELKTVKEKLGKKGKEFD
jgi:predicted  nucleic acid-binding Zn-ribbon protein